MRRPVDLDDDPRVKAGEVDDEAAENDLATEPEAGDLLPPESLPARVALRRRVRARGVNDLGMARPPTLERVLFR